MTDDIQQYFDVSDAWFPRHIAELDNCTHLVTKFEPDLDYDHPVSEAIFLPLNRRKSRFLALKKRYSITIHSP